MMTGQPVTITLTKEDFYSGPKIKFKRWDIFQVKNLPYSSGKRFNIITEDTETKNYSATVKMYGLNISRWWLIRKIQLEVLRTVFKRK